MKSFTAWIVLAWFCLSPVCRGAARTSLDLVGRWNGVVEFGQFKFKMNLRVAPVDNGRHLKVTLSNAEQGIQDMPINALLFNPPTVRIEMDMFGTAFVGKLSDDGNSIVGELEEGPGGRPVPVTYQRDLKPDPADLPRTYTFAAGEAADIRGYWQSTLEVEPGLTLPVSLRVGRLPDGTFDVALDSFEQGRTGIAAKTAVWTNAQATLTWESPELVVTGVLDAKNQSLQGEWKRGKASGPVRFERLETAATALPSNASSTPGADLTGDYRGSWSGVLEPPGAGKIRVVFKLAQLPDRSFVGTLGSPDQGPMEFRLSTVAVTNNTVHVESRGLHGSYHGTVNPAGREIIGKWDQNGQALKLNLQRETSPTEPRK